MDLFIVVRLLTVVTAPSVPTMLSALQQGPGVGGGDPVALWSQIVAQLGVTGVIVVVLIWVYRDVVGSLRTENADLRNQLEERTKKADEMNQAMMNTVAPAMVEMTRASRQMMELMVRRGDRSSPGIPGSLE